MAPFRRSRCEIGGSYFVRRLAESPSLREMGIDSIDAEVIQLDRIQLPADVDVRQLIHTQRAALHGTDRAGARAAQGEDRLPAAGIPELLEIVKAPASTSCSRPVSP
jgi:hypothetical protein